MITNLRLREVIALGAALDAAQTSGLVSALVERPAPVDVLAAKCGVDARACERILDLLHAFGVATRDGDLYGAGQDLTNLAAMPRALLQMESGLWRHVPEYLRTGESLLTMDAAPAEREGHYREVVAELGKLFTAAADQLAERCELMPEAILDVGCGSGVWSLAIARRAPTARVTGVDMPAVLDRFRERAAALGIADRIATIEGDMHSVPLPRGRWDLVVIANVLRLEQADAARSLIARIAAALRPGGSLLVIDALASGGVAAERARTVYTLHHALRTRTGRVHPRAEVVRWMEEAGCERPTSIAFDDAFVEAGALGALVAVRRAES